MHCNVMHCLSHFRSADAFLIPYTQYMIAPRQHIFSFACTWLSNDWIGSRHILDIEYWPVVMQVHDGEVASGSNGKRALVRLPRLVLMSK